VGRIEFGPMRRQSGGWAGTATVAYDGEEWGVELDMIDPYRQALVAFFDELARESKHGGVGASRWKSEFSELTLEARGAGDATVTLRFELWWSRDDALDNDREGELRVRAEELPSFAAQIRAIAGVDRPGR
jgi:hypothetical protein